MCSLIHILSRKQHKLDMIFFYTLICVAEQHIWFSSVEVFWLYLYLYFQMQGKTCTDIADLNSDKEHVTRHWFHTV